MKRIVLIICLTAFFLASRAGTPPDTVKIHTSAVCDMCKKTIERELSFEKGVKSAKLDVPSGDVTVVFHPGKTNADNIRQAIVRVGYDADTLKALPEAREKLPDCCKHPDGMK